MKILFTALLFFTFLFQFNLFAQQTKITPDDLIKLKTAGFEETTLQKFIFAESLSISVDEIIKLKVAGISEETIISLAIKEEVKTGINEKSNAIDWEDASRFDIVLANELVFDKVEYDDDEIIIYDFFWSPNDDSLIALLKGDGSKKYVLYDANEGKYIKFIESTYNLPKWASNNRTRFPPNSTLHSEKGNYLFKGYIKYYLNYDTDDEYSIKTTTNAGSVKRQYAATSINFYHTDYPPNSNMILISEDFDEGDGVYAHDIDPPYENKLIYSYEDNNIFTDEYNDRYIIKISSTGQRIAIANSEWWNPNAWTRADNELDLIVLDIISR